MPHVRPPNINMCWKRSMNLLPKSSVSC